MTGLTGEAREHLLARFQAWRKHALHIGLSPRRSPAWNGLLPREAQGCVAAYATVCDTALLVVGPRGGPDAAAAERLRRQAGDEFRWTIVVEEEQMVYRFPHGWHDWKMRGTVNTRFLDPEGITASIAPLLRHLGDSVGMVLLNIAPVYRTEALRFEEFLDALSRCLDALPPGHRYAVQTTEFLLPGCLEMLRERNVAYVSPLSPDAPSAHTADVSLVRSPLPGTEEDFRFAVRHALEEGQELYMYLGDGMEGGAVAPGAGGERLAHLMAGLDAELARLSPIRRQAA
jgi:hypothetical protein